MDSPAAPPPRSLARALVATLMGVGLLSRALPLLDQGGRLLRQFPTEDGYLMLTIARNLAKGHGMSTADGTIPTNGTQPLVNLLWSLGFVLSGGEREGGVLFALVCQVLVSLAAAWLLWRLAAYVWRDRPWGRTAAPIAAAVWFASPQDLPHTMNCLETGAYVLAWIGVALVFVRGVTERRGPWNWTRVILLGVLLGVTFWTRNDAVFLIAAVCLFRALVSPELRFALWGRGLVEAIVMGATSVLVASPWLVHNKLRFGSIVPISGTAQSMGSRLVDHLQLLPVKLAEYVMLAVPVPGSIEGRGWVTAATTLVVLVALLATARLLLGSRDRIWSLTLLVSLAGAGLVGYYTLFFGALHFLGRYLFPLSPFLALLATGLLARSGIGRSPRIAAAGAALLALLVVAQNVRLYARGDQHMHFQVVEWIEENVSDDQWVAAVQTGTIGFFHDRTLNLDGKVNPEALVARQAGRTQEYVLEKGVEVIADWYGIEFWADLPAFQDRFEVVVADPETNLSVLRRIP